MQRWRRLKQVKFDDCSVTLMMSGSFSRFERKSNASFAGAKWQLIIQLWKEMTMAPMLRAQTQIVSCEHYMFGFNILRISDFGRFTPCKKTGKG